MPRIIFKFSPLLAVSLLLCLPQSRAAETAPAKDNGKGAATEDPKKTASEKKPVAPTTSKDAAPSPDAAKAASTAPTTPPSAEPAATLPQVEVKKSKITELDHELHEQERNIAREAKNVKTSQADNALNSTAVNPTIFGGSSAKVRSELAQERVELMEFEKDLTEQIAHAKTKEEKTALKKQLEDIRTVRRNLEAPAREKER
jgi:hypothetical protein